MKSNKSKTLIEFLLTPVNNEEIVSTRDQSPMREAICIGDDQLARGEFSNRIIDEIIANNAEKVKKSKNPR